MSLEHLVEDYADEPLLLTGLPSCDGSLLQAEELKFVRVPSDAFWIAWRFKTDNFRKKSR